MLALLTPCESPSHSVWHLVSGVVTLALACAAAVAVMTWLG